MNVRSVFGWFFFLASIVLCGMQLASLPWTESLVATRTSLQFVSAVICLALGSLAAESSSRKGIVLLSAVALSICFLCLLGAGFLAAVGNSDMKVIHYALFLSYAGFYGLFGFSFSLLATGSGTSVTPSDAGVSQSGPSQA